MKESSGMDGISLLFSEPDTGAQHVGPDNLVESEPGASERDQE